MRDSIPYQICLSIEPEIAFLRSKLPKLDALSWSYILYVEHPELYLPFLAQDEDIAEEDVSLLIELFERNQVPERS